MIANDTSIRDDAVGDLWERFAGGAMELIISVRNDDTIIMRLYTETSLRRPPVGTVELGSRGRNVLAGQALSGYADLLCAAC